MSQDNLQTCLTYILHKQQNMPRHKQIWICTAQ